jgi:hypothetical protein
MHTVPSNIGLKAVNTDAASSNVANQESTSIRIGHLKLQNAYEADLGPLPVPVSTQYLNGTGWILSSTDNCTVLAVPSSGNDLLFNGGRACMEIAHRDKHGNT